MPLMKLRGEQLKSGIIKNAHIGEAIIETNLDINWAGHYRQALETRKLVDSVQVNNITVPANASSVDLTGLGVIPNTDPRAGSNQLAVEGVIVDAPKNRVTVRSAATGRPILVNETDEVYGRLTYDETEEAFILGLFYYDSVEEEEVEFSPNANTVINIQYMRRFNLSDIDELFAANERFVEGAADISAHLNIVQLAKDIYGPGYELDRDGQANLTTSLVQQIANEVARAMAAEADLSDAIDAESIARQQAITNLVADLASTSANKGASLIGIADVGDKFTATTVEAALLELKNDIAGLAGGGSGLSLASLDARLQAVEGELEDARGTFETLEERLVAVDQAIAGEASTRASADTNLQNQITTLANDYAAHKWQFYKYTVSVTEETSIVDVPSGKPNFTPSNGSLCVFLNGVLQEEGVNYAEKTGGSGVDFTPEVLHVGDKVTFWYYLNVQ